MSAITDYMLLVVEFIEIHEKCIDQILDQMVESNMDSFFEIPDEKFQEKTIKFAHDEIIHKLFEKFEILKTLPANELQTIIDQNMSLFHDISEDLLEHNK